MRVEGDARDVLVEDPGSDLALEVLADDVVDALARVAKAGRRHHERQEEREKRHRATEEERDPHQPDRREPDRRERHHLPVLGQPPHAEHRAEQEGHGQHVLEEVRDEVDEDAQHVPGRDAAPEEDVGLGEELRGEKQLREEEERRRERQQDLPGEVAVEPRHAFLSDWSLTCSAASLASTSRAIRARCSRTLSASAGSESARMRAASSPALRAPGLADCHRAHRDAARHLRGGEERVEAGEVARGQRHAQDRATRSRRRRRRPDARPRRRRR